MVLGGVGMGVVKIVGIEFEVITNILFFLITIKINIIKINIIK